jgi:transcriptional regulator with XRE-family HTH domain
MSPSDLQQLGETLRERREAAGLSMRAAAERSGLVASTVSRLEKGEIDNPGPGTLQALARTYGADIEDFYALVGYFTPEGLPELRAYLRVKYDLPEQAADQLDEYFQALRDKWQATTKEAGHDAGGGHK